MTSEFGSGSTTSSSDERMRIFINLVLYCFDLVFLRTSHHPSLTAQRSQGAVEEGHSTGASRPVGHPEGQAVPSLLCGTPNRRTSRERELMRERERERS
jgi:hypothetical protein